MRDSLGIDGLIALPVLCCVGPPDAGALGSWLTNPWLIGVAVRLVLAVAAWRVAHPARPARCAPSSA